MKFTCDSNECSIFQKNVKRSKEGEQVNYICLTDVTFDDTYALPSIDDLYQPQEFDCVDPRDPEHAPDIIIRVPNNIGSMNEDFYDFGLSKQQFCDMATKRLVQKTWQDYDIQELVIAKDFRYKQNVNFFCDTDKGEIRSTMQVRNESRERNSTGKEIMKDFVEYCEDENKQYTIKEFAEMFENFVSEKADRQHDVVNLGDFTEERTEAAM